MSKRALFLVLAACLTVGIASSASAATTWKRLGANPFTSPSLSSEADLKSLVKNRSVDLKTGFTKAGYPDLYPAFMEQFPAARIDSVTVAPGDSFEWVVFKKKATGNSPFSRPRPGEAARLSTRTALPSTRTASATNLWFPTSAAMSR